MFVKFLYFFILHFCCPPVLVFDSSSSKSKETLRRNHSKRFSFISNENCYFSSDSLKAENFHLKLFLNSSIERTHMSMYDFRAFPPLTAFIHFWNKHELGKLRPQTHKWINPSDLVSSSPVINVCCGHLFADSFMFFCSLTFYNSSLLLSFGCFKPSI